MNTDVILQQVCEVIGATPATVVEKANLYMWNRQIAQRALRQLESWDMLSLNPDGTGSATADAPYFRRVIAYALGEPSPFTDKDTNMDMENTPAPKTKLTLTAEEAVTAKEIAASAKLFAEARLMNAQAESIELDNASRREVKA